MNTLSLQVPKSWDEITPDWMSTALSERHPGATVKEVTLELRDDGTNRRARLGLTYSAGSGPGTVFVKAADPAHKELIRMTSGMFHEPRLFNSGVDLPLEHPVVYTALIDEDAYDFFMVMEDLNARQADPRDSTRPLSVEQRLWRGSQRRDIGLPNRLNEILDAQRHHFSRSIIAEPLKGRRERRVLHSVPWNKRLKPTERGMVEDSFTPILTVHAS